MSDWKETPEKNNSEAVEMKAEKEQLDKELQQDIEKSTRPQPDYLDPEFQKDAQEWKETHFSETGKQSIRGYPLSTEAQGTIVDLNKGSVEQRQQTVTEFNQTSEGREAAKKAGGIMRDGKGVNFQEPDGSKHEIHYEDENRDASNE